MAKIVGYLTGIEGRVAKGWALDLDEVDRELMVELVVGDEVLARAWAGLPRPQVQMRYGGTGFCGFTLEAPEGRKLEDLKVRERETGHVLKSSKSFSIVPAKAKPAKPLGSASPDAGKPSKTSDASKPAQISDATPAAKPVRPTIQTGGGSVARPVPFSLFHDRVEGTASFHIVFVLNLLQDVNVVRPLVYLAASDFDVKIGFLVSDGFLTRDTRATWIEEVRSMARETRAELHVYDTAYTAFEYLQGKQGILVAGSESNLKAHDKAHTVFRVAPAGFLKVTLQHGFECIGFLQNWEQSAVHGTHVTFAADVVCGWCEGDFLRSLAPSERPKLHVSGPPSLLQARPMRAIDAPVPGNGGIVCENMHSVRFSIASDRKTDFMTDFRAFCETLDRGGKRVTLRPHPGGQYTVKNNVALGSNVSVENAPMYRVDLTRYDYGISAPSTVVLDMVLAGIPTAVWRDPNSEIDTSNYAGLRSISGLEDWLAFEREATSDPRPILEQQRRFLERLSMPLDPSDVRSRLARLFAGAGAPVAPHPATWEATRLLFIVDGASPSVTEVFFRPLQSLVDAGFVTCTILSQTDIERGFADPDGEDAAAWMRRCIQDCDPELIVVCCYSGPHAATILETANKSRVATICYLDGDPFDSSEPFKAEASHLAHRRIGIAALIRQSSLVYCSTPSLMHRMQSLGFHRTMVAAQIAGSDQVRRAPNVRAQHKIGYVCTDDSVGVDHDLDSVSSALVAFLRRDSEAVLELLGTSHVSTAFDEFGERVRRVPIGDDDLRLSERLATMDWDVGLCPLADLPLNEVKTDTRWAEYTAAGIAVVAQNGSAYERVSADGCVILAESPEEWTRALETLCGDDQIRVSQLTRAQEKLAKYYSIDCLHQQILDVLKIVTKKAIAPIANDEKQYEQDLRHIFV